MQLQFSSKERPAKRENRNSISEKKKLNMLLPVSFCLLMAQVFKAHCTMHYIRMMRRDEKSWMDEIKL